MRILTVTHFFEAHGGGIERVAGHLNRGLRMLGYDVRWAASDEDPLPNMDCGTIIPLRCSRIVHRISSLPMPIPHLTALGRLRRAVQDSDAVVIHDALYVTSVAAMLFARKARRPVVLVQHIARIPFRSQVMGGLMTLANAIITRPMLKAADHVIYISETTRHAFSSLVLKRAAILQFNGVDSSIFRLSRGNRDAVLTDLDLDPGKQVALFVGRFVVKKGIAAMRELAVLRPDLQVVVAGKGPIDPDGWGLPNVKVVRDRSGHSLAALYCASDALLLPSFGEGYPLVVQEALACGLPVICDEGSARADPAAQCWVKGVPVTLHDPKKTAALFSEAFDKLRLDDSQKAAMSTYAEQAYSWAAFAHTISDVLTFKTPTGAA